MTPGSMMGNTVSPNLNDTEHQLLQDNTGEYLTAALPHRIVKMLYSNNIQLFVLCYHLWSYSLRADVFWSHKIKHDDGELCYVIQFWNNM